MRNHFIIVALLGVMMVLCAALPHAAWAQTETGDETPRATVMRPDSPLDDAAAEARARAVMKELRCVVCDGESVDESNAALAKDMRMMVRENIAAGQTRDEILAYMTARYGDGVLMTPPVAPRSLILWVVPVLLPLCGLGLLVRHLSRASRHAGAERTEGDA